VRGLTIVGSRRRSVIFKYKMKRAYKVPKEGGSSIIEEYTWRGINISLTGKSKEVNALTFQLTICEITIRSGSFIQEGHVAIDQSMKKFSFRSFRYWEVEESRKQLTVGTRDMGDHEKIWTVESSRLWTVDLTPFSSFRYRELEVSRTLMTRMMKHKIAKHLLAQPVVTVSGHVRGRS
jgi:hypothetical protein